MYVRSALPFLLYAMEHSSLEKLMRRRSEFEQSLRSSQEVHVFEAKPCANLQQLHDSVTILEAQLQSAQEASRTSRFLNDQCSCSVSATTLRATQGGLSMRRTENYA
jgi:hypothetical protein